MSLIRNANNSGRSSGTSLVEVLVVMLMSGILATGMLLAYTQSIKFWKAATEKNVMYNEGSLVLSKMSSYIRNADYIMVRSVSGHPEARMDIRYPDKIGGSASFYFEPQHRRLKWNDQTMGNNRFNMTLLPYWHFRTSGYDDEPYLYVDDIRFVPLDDIGQRSPQLYGYSLIKIDLYLSDNRDNELHLTSVYAKRNKRR